MVFLYGRWVLIRYRGSTSRCEIFGLELACFKDDGRKGAQARAGWQAFYIYYRFPGRLSILGVMEWPASTSTSSRGDSVSGCKGIPAPALSC